MKYLPKDVHKLKGKELAEVLFPKAMLDKVKRDLDSKPAAKPAKKK
jgi:hypothetical protein